MEKYNRSPVTIQSFSYNKMHRKIRETILSTEIYHSWFDNRKDWANASLRYKYYRKPVWRLPTAPVLADAWPKSRRIVNLLSSAYRNVRNGSDLKEDSLIYLPVSPLIKTRPKLSLHSRRPLRLPLRDLTHSSLANISRASLPRISLCPYSRSFVPQRSVTKDCGYLYETKSGKSTHSSELGLKSRLLSRTSTYSFPIICEEPITSKASNRLAERMYNIYANRTLEADISNQLAKSRLVSQSSGYKVAQFTTSRSTQNLTNRVKTVCNPVRRTTVKISTVNVPKTFAASTGRWSKPFLPNAPLGPGRTYSSRRSNIDDFETTTYIGLPKHSLRVRETELASNYKPQLHTTGELYKHSSTDSSNIHRRCVTRSEAIPVNTDIALRLRLGCRISSTGMDYLYPKNAPLKVPEVVIKPKRRIQKFSNEELEMKLNPTTIGLQRAQRLLKATKATSFSAPPLREPTKPLNKVILRPLPSCRKITVNNDYLYPSNPRKMLTPQFSIRPLPGSDFKLRPTRLRPNINLDDEEESDTEIVSHRLLRSANNYSQLYVAHPENLPTTELGQRLKLSLRSSTSKISSLYASYPVSSMAVLPARRRKPQPETSFYPKIPKKYSADAYVPRPGIVKTSSRVHCVLHGML